MLAPTASASTMRANTAQRANTTRLCDMLNPPKYLAVPNGIYVTEVLQVGTAAQIEGLRPSARIVQQPGRKVKQQHKLLGGNSQNHPRSTIQVHVAGNRCQDRTLRRG